MPRLESVVLAGGPRTGPTKSKLGRRGTRHRPSFTKARERDPRHRTPPQKIEDRATDSRITPDAGFWGQVRDTAPRRSQGLPEAMPDQTPSDSSLPEGISEHNNPLGTDSPPARHGGFQAELTLRGVLAQHPCPLPPILGQRPRNSPFLQTRSQCLGPHPHPHPSLNKIREISAWSRVPGLRSSGPPPLSLRLPSCLGVAPPSDNALVPRAPGFMLEGVGAASQRPTVVLSVCSD